MHLYVEVQYEMRSELFRQFVESCILSQMFHAFGHDDGTLI